MTNGHQPTNATTDASGRDAREDYYERIASRHLRPLWEVLHALVPEQPQPKCVPALWRYAEVREPLIEAGRIISAEEAVRRVLILENPALPGQSCITNTLYAGLQLLNPGETAPAHRHTQSALRFVLEGQGAYTSVDGQRHYMSPGDLVLTPAWTWHDHANEGDETVIWLDGLDIPLVRMLDAGFCESPDGTPLPTAAPVVAFPYGTMRESLFRASGWPSTHPAHGHRLRYENPASGDHVLPTIASFLQRLPAGFEGTAWRQTDATVYVCVEGEGRTKVDGQTIEWGPRDIFVVPSWCPFQHSAVNESVLFAFSDRVVQERLDLWRESAE
jgi:gentisate 1,2-dioxygenase